MNTIFFEQQAQNVKVLESAFIPQKSKEYGINLQKSRHTANTFLSGKTNLRLIFTCLMWPHLNWRIVFNSYNWQKASIMYKH